jgi:hypothetical protein
MLKDQTYAQVKSLFESVRDVCQTEAATVVNLMNDIIYHCVYYQNMNAEETTQHMVNVCRELQNCTQIFIDRVLEPKVQEITTGLIGMQVSSVNFDEEIHDLKSGEAADINNGGFQDQVNYLLQCGYTDKQIYELVED